MSRIRAPFVSRSRPGAAIVPLIVTLLLLAGVGLSVHDLLNTSALEQPAAVPARAALYAAEAGIRLAAAEYNAQGAAADRAALFANIDGRDFVLDSATDSRFRLDVFSYGFRPLTHNTGTRTITARAVRRVPLADMADNSSGPISMPAGSLISVRDEIGNDIPATLAAAATVHTDNDGSQIVTFTYSPLPGGAVLGASADLDFVNIAHATDSLPSGSAASLGGLPGDMGNFPPENGRIYIPEADKTYTYRERVVEGDGSVTLRGLEAQNGSFAVSDFRDSTVILRTAYALRSTGSVGTDAYSAQKTLVHYDSPSDEGTNLDPVERVADPNRVIETTMNDLTAFNSSDRTLRLDGSDRTVLEIKSYQSTQGTHINYAAIHSLERDSSGPWGHVVRLNKDSLFRWRWKQDTRLSYDVQTKLSSGWKLPFALAGLSLRLTETGTSGQYDFYGVSFLKFYGSGPLPSRWYWFNWYTVRGDHIPDGVKPTGQGTTVHTWNSPPELEGSSSYPLNITESDRVLLVFWRNKNGVSTWLAYKVLGYQDNNSSIVGEWGMYPKQQNIDGRIVSDNTTLVVRAEEQFVNGEKVNRFKVFYGDASNRSGLTSRTGDALAYNIITGASNSASRDRGRLRYRPEWVTNRGHAYPLYPVLRIGDWSASADYFTFIMDAPAYGLHQCKWDRINTTAIAADPTADIRLLSDGGTIRTREFLSPNSATWPANPNNWPSNRPEVGLHAYGRLIRADSGNNAVTFDDLALGFLLYEDTPTPLVD
jgi:hypothetical protein